MLCILYRILLKSQLEFNNFSYCYNIPKDTVQRNSRDANWESEHTFDINLVYVIR